MNACIYEHRVAIYILPINNDRIAQAKQALEAGADVIVVGNAIEKDASLIREMSDAVHSVPVLR